MKNLHKKKGSINMLKMIKFQGLQAPLLDTYTIIIQTSRL